MTTKRRSEPPTPEAPADETVPSGGPEPADAEPADSALGEHRPTDAEPSDVERPDTERPDTEAADQPPDAGTAEPAARASGPRKRDPLAAALIGVLTLLLGFAFAVQVRSTGEGEALTGAREEDLVRILDELNAQEDRLRQQIAEQRTALEQLTSSDSQAAAALQEARERAEAIGILNGTLAARGPGLVISIRDPEGEVRVADLLDAIQELRGAGAETMQIDDVRIGVSSAVTGDPGELRIDDTPIDAPYEIVVIGSPQNMETALNIPGGVVQRITGRGGAVSIRQSEEVVVDALRPLDEPQYAAPDTGD